MQTGKNKKNISKCHLLKFLPRVIDTLKHRFGCNFIFFIFFSNFLLISYPMKIYNKNVNEKHTCIFF